MQTIYTRPQPERSALITIDVQRDFLDDGASAISGTTAVLPAVQRVLSWFRSQGRPIIHAIRLYEADGSNIDLCRRHVADEGHVPVCRGSSGAEIASMLGLPALDSQQLLRGRLQLTAPSEWIMYKPRWGAFYRTSLEQHLRRLDVSTIVVAGCNFPNCPRTSVYEASERDFRIVVVKDAISGAYDRGLAELEGIGAAVMESADVAAWADGQAPQRRSHLS